MLELPGKERCAIEVERSLRLARPLAYAPF